LSGILPRKRWKFICLVLALMTKYIEPQRKPVIALSPF
jgi:hypothetical protein